MEQTKYDCLVDEYVDILEKHGKGSLQAKEFLVNLNDEEMAKDFRETWEEPEPEVMKRVDYYSSGFWMGFQLGVAIACFVMVLTRQILEWLR